MVTTHHPLLAHPCTPTYIHPLIHSAPRLLICRRTRIGTHTHTHVHSCVHVSRARARVASDAGSYVSVRLRVCMCVCSLACARAQMCANSRCVSESVSACVSSSDERKKEWVDWGRRPGGEEEERARGRTGRTERRGRIRARVGETRRVFIRRRRARGRQRQRGWGEGEINVFVLRPPSYAPGEREGSLAALARRSHRRMAETTWPGST